VLDSRGALGRAYAEVTNHTLAAIRAAGRELVAQGASPAEALDQLAAQGPRWASIGGSATRAIASRLASGS
jgi:hypothetical protein